MQNVVPNSARPLTTLAGEMAAGANQYGGSIPLVLVTEPVLRGKITPLAEASGAIGQGRKELKTRRTAVRTKVRQARAYLTLARDTFKPKTGNKHNQEWHNVGLIGSLMIPRNERDVVGLLLSVKTFLTNNPQFECTVDGTEIKAAVVGSMFTQLEGARAAVNLQKKMIKDLVLDREVKAAALRKCVRDMIAELTIKLTPLDSRWLAFGLNMPGAEAAPVVPSDVTVVLVGASSASVKWGASARAKYYRVWTRTAATEPWVAAGSPADLDFTLEQLLGNSKTEVAVSAVNSGGESALSAITSVTTPA